MTPALDPHALLVRGVEAIEAQARQGRFNTMLIPKIGATCRLLGFELLTARIKRILASVPNEKFFEGGLGNFEPDAGAVARLRQLPDPVEFEKEFTTFQLGQIEAIADERPAMRLARSRNYEEAMALARLESRDGIETSLAVEVAVTAAVLGNFTIAETMLDEDLRDHERRLLDLVLAIERARAGNRSESTRHVEALEPLADWNFAHLALGFAGRRSPVPWA